MKLIDLSVYSEANPYAEAFLPTFTFFPHQKSAEMMSAKMGIDSSAFSGGMALAHEDFSGQMHVGTHVDSPLHFGPLCEGKKSRSIDELPLDWFYHDGIVLDLRQVAPKALITVEDLEHSLAQTGYLIKPYDIVLLMTGFDKYLYEQRYLQEQPGMSREATIWLLDQGVKVIGIDTYGFDRPFPVMAEEVKKGNSAALFPAHFVGREREYCHIEKLGNLDEIPVPYGFKVVAFPQKIRNGTAGGARVVAIVEE